MPESRGAFVERLSQTKVAQQTVTKYIAMIGVNFVLPKAGAKGELLFNKPASLTFDASILLALSSVTKQRKVFIYHNYWYKKMFLFS